MIISDCGDPLVANSVSYGDTFYTGKSIISCNNGYKLNGNSIITCTENGTWSAKPTCDSVGKSFSRVNYIDLWSCNTCQSLHFYNC